MNNASVKPHSLPIRHVVLLNSGIPLNFTKIYLILVARYQTRESLVRTNRCKTRLIGRIIGVNVARVGGEVIYAQIG